MYYALSNNVFSIWGNSEEVYNVGTTYHPQIKQHFSCNSFMPLFTLTWNYHKRLQRTKNLLLTSQIAILMRLYRVKG